MPDFSNVCAMIRLSLSRHGYSRPLPKDFVVGNAAISTDQEGQAKSDFEWMRSLDFIENHGKRGIQIDNSEFGDLADFLYYQCDWKPWKIKQKLGHHYEGWMNHEWL